jgi:hypothetical protein
MHEHAPHAFLHLSFYCNDILSLIEADRDFAAARAAKIGAARD